MRSMVSLHGCLRVAAALMALAGSGAAALSAQSVSAPVRVAEVRTVPDEPGFGEEFELRLTLRASTANVVLMPDSLIGAESVSIVRPGVWGVAEAPGDSVDIVAVYPVIGFRAGPVLLPSIELSIGAADGAETGRVARASDLTPDVAAAYASLELPLGAVLIHEFPPMVDADSALLPRPAADVLGDDWSVWLMLAIGLASVAGAGGAGSLLGGWWSAKGAAWFRRWRTPSPRNAALQELERIRSSGWHRNGRLDEFYAATTGTLRRFTGQIEAEWVSALTSGELLARLEERWGPRRAENLRPVIDISERVKFGLYRPSPEDAERDWTVIRDWVRGCPEK